MKIAVRVLGLVAVLSLLPNGRVTSEPARPPSVGGATGLSCPSAGSACTGASRQPVDPLADRGLLCLQELVPDLVADVRYATANNFTGQRIYQSTRLYLLAPAARQFAAAARYLKLRYGLRFRVFDAYRPLSVQKKFWAILPDPDYVANPATGSRHNRGAAVDLTASPRRWHGTRPGHRVRRLFAPGRLEGHRSVGGGAKEPPDPEVGAGEIRLQSPRIRVVALRLRRPAELAHSGRSDSLNSTRAPAAGHH